MKNLHYILFANLLLLATACDNKLDIEPQQSISEGIALNSDANVKLVLLGAYDNLSQEGVYGGDMVRDAELAGADGEIRWVGTFVDPREIFNHTMVPTNFYVEKTWAQAYAAINTCNNVLSALAVVNADDRIQVEGEARFIRAACYFELVRLYSKSYVAATAASDLGVPLVTEPTRGVNDASLVARASVKQVFDFVEAELHTAYDLLPELNDVYATKFAAAAMIARLHLTTGEYDEAQDFAGMVIASGFYSLLPNYSDLWNQDNDTPESIFSMQVSDQDGDNELVTFFSIPQYGGRDGDIEINQKHLDLYNASDTRFAMFYLGSGATRTGKWRDQYKNIPLIRLAEMYLINAECKARLQQNADDDYNAVHTRAGLTAKTGVTLDDILLERRLELAFEGHRIHDIKRLRGTADGLNWDDKKLVYPIPARELEANRNLEQNDGY